MKYLLLDRDKKILYIGTNKRVDDKGVIWIDGAGFALYGQSVAEVSSVPNGVEPNIYKYENGEFVPYTSEIDRLRQEAIDDYTLELINGGIIQ